jgi:translocation and assembly module TamB
VGVEGGTAKLDASLALAWQGPLPEPLASGPASLELSLDRFSLAALTPATAGVVRKIDGKLSGSLALTRDVAGKDSLTGTLTLRDGALHLPTLGQEIEGGTFVLVAKPDGEITLDELSLSSRGGRLTGKGRAQLDGLSLTTASLALSVLEREALPLALDGVSMGRFHGVIGAFAKREDDLYVVSVDVPTLTLELPSSTSSNVAPLDPHPTVTLRGPTGPEGDEAPARPIPLDLTVKIGKVRVRGSGIDLELASDAKAPLHVTGDDRRTSGRIVTSKGTVEVMSKRFDVERGLVELRADSPKNPYVNLVARWDAPDGTRVYVEYVGLLFPLDDDKLTLRATPARGQQELMALLVLGPDLAQGTAGTETVGNTASRTAANVGGGLAAEQINALLRGMPALRGLSLKRLGADDEGTFTSTITFELNDKLAASATYTGAKAQTATAVSGAAGGTANQRTGSTMVSVDWRFMPKFLLRATFGWGDVMSSGLDLLWQYKY